MASQAGQVDTQKLLGEPLYARHNPNSQTPGLPVAANVILYAGVMVAYDPANAQVVPADPSMTSTSVVIGIMRETVDNRGGLKGAKTASPEAGTYRIKHDGNLTTAHITKFVDLIDDHTVGPAAGDNTDRLAGKLSGLDGDYAIVGIYPWG